MQDHRRGNISDRGEAFRFGEAVRIRTSRGGSAAVYHLSAGGRVSWCGFAGAIVAATRRQSGRTPKVTPIPSAEYPLPARRPANSILSNAKLQRTFHLTLPRLG